MAVAVAVAQSGPVLQGESVLQPGSALNQGMASQPSAAPVVVPGSATAAPASAQSSPGGNAAGGDSEEREKGLPNHAMVRRQPQAVLGWAFGAAALVVVLGCAMVASRDPRVSKRAARHPRPQGAY